MENILNLQTMMNMSRNNSPATPKHRIKRANSSKQALFLAHNLQKKDEAYVRSATEKAKAIAMAFAERDLQTEDSLVKISEEISSIVKQNTLIHSQLITMSHEQVDDAQAAVAKINESSQILADIQGNFEVINSKSVECQNLITNYDTIKTVQNVLTNVTLAREWLARVLRLTKEIRELKKILRAERRYFEEDETSEDEDEDETEENDDDFDAAEYGLEEILVYDPENEGSMLLEVHERIQELEMFRSVVFAEAEEKPVFLDTFSSYLSVIDEVSEQFMYIIDKHLEKVVQLADEDPSRLVRIARIIEREEKATKEFEERARANPGTISLKKQPKNLKSYFSEKLRSGIRQYFKENLDDCSDIESKLERIQELCSGDLIHVERRIVPCFPSPYNILSLFVSEYESQLREFVHSMAQEKVSNSDRVIMIVWLNENSDIFEEYKHYLQCDNFEQELNLLKGDYLTDFNLRLQEWSEKVIVHSIKPDTKLQEEDGCVYTYAPTDFFTFLNQTITAVGATKQRELIEKIAFAVRNTLFIFKDQLLSNLVHRMDEFSTEKICAHINDCSRCVQFTVELEEALVEILPKARKEVFEMDEVTDGFESVAKQILKRVANRLFSQLGHYFDDQFGKMWYNKNKVSTIMMAFRELTKEFERTYLEFLEYKYIGVLAENLLNQLIKKYIDGWIVKSFSLKPEEIDIVKAEIGAFKKFCGNEPWSFELLKPLDFLKDFLSIIDIEDVSAAIGDALSPKNFPDMPIFIPETIIRKCGKYKKKEQDELIASITKFYEGWEEMNQNKERKKTIFSLYRKDEKIKKGFFRRQKKTVITGVQEEKKPEANIPLPNSMIKNASQATPSKNQAEEPTEGDIMDLDAFLNDDTAVTTSAQDKREESDDEEESEEIPANADDDNNRHKLDRTTRSDSPASSRSDEEDSASETNKPNNSSTTTKTDQSSSNSSEHDDSSDKSESSDSSDNDSSDSD